jgi:hypothetical protein
MKILSITDGNRSMHIQQVADDLVNLLLNHADEAFTACSEDGRVEYSVESDGCRWVASIRRGHSPDVIIDHQWTRVVRHLLLCGLRPHMIQTGATDGYVMGKCVSA